MIERRKNGSARGDVGRKDGDGKIRERKKRGAAMSLYESVYTQDDEDGSTSGGGSL